MPTQITNRASLTFEYGEAKGFATSNLAMTTLQETLSVSLVSLGGIYSLNNDICYIVTVTNNNHADIRNVKITDDLGSYYLGNILISPLTYKGPAQLYISGVFNSEIEPKVSVNKVTFTVPVIPSDSNVMIIYRAVPNDKASLEFNSTITNTGALTARSLCEPLSVSNTVRVLDAADVRIVKSMAPNPIIAGGRITYTFFLYNYGNAEATNVVMTDKFNPAPAMVNVTVDGMELALKDYNYINDVLTIPSVSSNFSLSIPPATFSQDPFTGIVSAEPGLVTIVATGKI